MRKLGILVATAFLLAGCYSDSANLQSSQGNPSFFFKNDLYCKFLTDQQTGEKTESYEGKNVSFVGLNTNQPRVLFPSGSGSQLFQKKYETDRTLVIQLVASWTGSTDTFTINKVDGTFSETGAGTILGGYTFTRTGTCK